MRSIFLIFFISPFIFKSFAQIGIGTTNPHSSSILDVESENKGFLLPRLRTSERDLINGGSFAEGLVIYNRDHKCINIYNGEAWINPCEAPAPIAGISCDMPDNTRYLGSGLENNVTYTNSSPTNNQIIRVYYQGGNGENYSEETISSANVTGLDAKVAFGTLNNGDGFVDFIIEGMASSTGVASFDISFLGVAPTGGCSQIDVNIISDPFISDAICQNQHSLVSHSLPFSSASTDLGNVAVAGNGNTMVAVRRRYGTGVTFCENNGLCVYLSIFDKDNSGNWIEAPVVTNENAVLMGDRVSHKNIVLSDDGNTIVATSSANTVDQNYSGKVIIFERVGNTWTNTAEINALGYLSTQNELSISGDGSTIVFKKRIFSKGSSSTWSNSPSFIDIPNLGYVLETSISDDGKKVVFSHNEGKNEASTTSIADLNSRQISLYEYNDLTDQWVENSVDLGIPASQHASLYPAYPIALANPGGQIIDLGNALISGDGNTITYQYAMNDGADNWYLGYFYVQKYNSTTNQWELTQIIDLNDYEPFLSNSLESGIDPYTPATGWGVNYRLNDDGNKIFIGHDEVFQDCNNTPPMEFHGAGYISYFKFDGTTYNHERIISPSAENQSIHRWRGPFDISDNGDLIIFVNNSYSLAQGGGRIAVFD